MSLADVVFVQTIVETVPILASSTFVTLVPKPGSGQPPIAYPYALIHPTGGTDEQTRYTGPASTEHPEFTIHIAGASAEQVQTVTDLLKAVVIVDGFGIIPAVTGRRNQRMFWRQPIPIQSNTEVVPPMCFAVVETGWVSDPS